MLPQGEANEQLVWIQQDSQVLTVLNHTSDERGDVSVSDAYWNITNVPMGGALADAGVDAAVYGEALAAVDRRVRRFWNSAVLECCLVLLIFFATVLPLDLLGLGEQVERVQNFVVASLVALWLGVTLASPPRLRLPRAPGVQAGLKTPRVRLQLLRHRPGPAERDRARRARRGFDRAPKR